MALRFTCPNCHRELEVPDEAAGTAGTCRLCGAAIIAPSAPGKPARLAQAPGAAPPSPEGAPTAPAPHGRIEPFGILSESWDLVWKNFGPIAFGTYVPGAIFVVAFLAVMLLLGMTSLISPTKPPPWLNVVVFALYLALCPLLAAPLYVADDLLTRRQAEMSAIFRGFQRYRAFVVFNVFYYLLPNVAVVLLGYVLQALGWTGALLTNIANLSLAMFVLATIYPGIMEIVDRDADGLSAVKASWEFTRGHRWMILLTWIVVGFAAIAGIFAFCVGVLVTVLLWSPATVLLYRDIRGLQGGSGVLVTGPVPGAPARGRTPWAMVTLAGCCVLVIPILAAILFPVFAKAREKAKMSACLNSMRIQELALMQYASDHNDRLPPARRWEDDVAVYLKGKADGCPDAKSGTGYVFNAAMGGQPLPTGAAASTTVLLFDGGTGGRNQTGYPTAAEARHGELVTIGYTDGHVEMVPHSNGGPHPR